MTARPGSAQLVVLAGAKCPALRGRHRHLRLRNHAPNGQDTNRRPLGGLAPCPARGRRAPACRPTPSHAASEPSNDSPPRSASQFSAFTVTGYPHTRKFVRAGRGSARRNASRNTCSATYVVPAKPTRSPNDQSSLRSCSPLTNSSAVADQWQGGDRCGFEVHASLDIRAATRCRPRPAGASGHAHFPSPTSAIPRSEKQRPRLVTGPPRWLDHLGALVDSRPEPRSGNPRHRHSLRGSTGRSSFRASC